MDDDANARDFNEDILKLRERVVKQIKSNITLNMKMHLDLKVRETAVLESYNVSFFLFREESSNTLAIFIIWV